MKSEFLTDVRINDEVSIFVNSVEFIGTIIALTKDSVQIKTQSGSPKIKIEQISVYDVRSSTRQADHKDLATFVSNESSGLPVSVSDKFQGIISGKMNLLKGVSLEHTITLTEIKGYVLNSPEYKKDDDYRRSIQPVLGKLEYASKIKELVNGNSRVNSALTEISKLVNIYTINSSALLIKGFIHYVMKQNDAAAECFLAAKHYLLAFRVARDHMLLLEIAAFSLLDKEVSDIALLTLYNARAEAIPVWKEIYSQMSNYKSDEIMDIHTVCVASLLQEKDTIKAMHFPNKLQFFDAKNIDYLSTLLAECNMESNALKKYRSSHIEVEGLPQEPQDVISDYSDGNSKTDNITEFKGVILRFDSDRFFGFIGGHNVPPSIMTGDVFFHYKQINDDKLRYRLVNNDFADCIVSFTLGYDAYTHRINADNVKFIHASEQTLTYPTILGEIEEYNRFYGKGKIYFEGESYNFFEANIKDPYLKAYLKNCINPDGTKILFSHKNTGNKKITSVISAKEYSADEIDVWLQLKDISQSAIQEWKKYVSRHSKISKNEEGIISDLYMPLTPYDGKHEFVQIKKAPIPQRDQQPHALPSPTNNAKLEQQVIQDYTEAIVLSSQSPTTEQDLLKAASLLTNVLEHEDILYKIGKLESTIMSLFGTNMRLNRYEYLEDIFEQYKNDKRISYARLLNSYVQLQERKKADVRAIIPLYLELIELTQKQNTRMHFLFRLAYYQKTNNNFDAALQTYKLWVQSLESKDEISVQENKLKQTVLQEISVCYYMLDSKSEAMKLAREILRQNPNNTIAKEIVDNRFAWNNIQHLDDIHILNEDTIGLDYEHNGMSDFIINSINNVDISSATKSPHIKDGFFAGNASKARDIIKALINARGSSPMTRYTYLLSAAKIMLQVCERDDIDESELKKYNLSKSLAFTYATRGMCSLGDHIAQDLKAPIDSVVYIYLQVLSLTNSEQDWQNAFINSLHAFFNDRHKLQDLIRARLASHRKDSIEFSFISKTEPTISIHEYTIGIVIMLRALNQNSYAEDLVKAMFNSKTKSKLIQELTELNDSAYESLTYGEFREFLHRAKSEMDEKIRETERTFDDFLMNISSDLRREESLISLVAQSKLKWFCSTDNERIGEIEKIGKYLVTFDITNEFEKKSVLLSEMLSRLKNLCENIERYPTLISYEVLLQRLYRFREILTSKRRELFENYKPELKISQMEQSAIINEKGIARVQFTIENRKGHQMADNIVITILNSDQLDEQNMPEAHIRGVRGGDTGEAIISLVLQSEFNQLESLDIGVSVSYEYNDENSETIKDSLPEKTFPTSFLEPSSFQIINNPYRGKTENIMVSEEMFYGRDALLEKLTNQIVDSYGNFNEGHAVALWGQTRAGKSSVLYHCKNKIRIKFASRAIIASFGSAGELEGDRGFFFLMVSSIIEELEEYHTELYEQAVGLGINDYSDRIVAQPDNAQILFSDFCKKLTKLLRKQQEKKIVVLLIDEFTYLHTWIKSGKLSQDFMKFWKAIMQDYRFYAIVVGQDNMPIFKMENQNEFASMELEPVTYLSEEYAYKLMSEPLQRENGETRYKAGALEKLFELTAGSAYLILILCDTLTDYMNQTRFTNITKALIDEFLNVKVLCQNGCVDRATFEPQLKDRAIPGIERNNERLLLAIARASQITGQADISKIPRDAAMTDSEQEEVFNRLVERNVIHIFENKYCKIVVSLLKEWLLFTYGQED